MNKIQPQRTGKIWFRLKKYIKLTLWDSFIQQLWSRSGHIMITQINRRTVGLIRTNLLKQSKDPKA